MRCCIGALCLFVHVALVVGVDAEDPRASKESCDPYCPKQEVTGEIRMVGSTTMQQLAALWADGFQQIHPQVRIEIDGRGSESALPGVAKDPSVIGLLSRPLSDEEQRQLEGASGGRVVALTVCHDALGVIAHKENPLPSLAWSPESGLLLRSGKTSTAKTWGDLGLAGDWSTMPIRIHGPTSQSGTRSYIDRLLPESESEGGAYALVEHASHADLVRAVSADRGGLGLISLSRGALEDVRIVPVGLAGQPSVAPTEEEIAARRYPLLRSLSIVFSMPGETLEEPLREEFIAYILSRCGQQDVTKDGFLPLNRSELHVQEEKLGWNRLQ